MKRLSLEALKGSAISSELTSKLTGGECVYCHPKTKECWHDECN